MVKRRYKQIAKLRKWRDVKLSYHAFVVNAKWLARYRKKYIFPKSYFEGGDVDE